MKTLAKAFPLLLSLVILAKSSYFFIANPTFVEIWDWVGHIQKAQHATWPGFGNDWDTTFWGGYSTTIYPSFYHLILRGMMETTRSQRWGAAILTTIIIILQLLALWKFAKRAGKWRIAAFTGTLLFVVQSPGSLLGSLIATLYSGGGPAALGSVFLLLLLSSESWAAQGLFLGLTLLTHPLTASVGVLYLLLKCRSQLRSSLFSLLTGFSIGLPWILPYLDPSFATTGINLEGSTIILPSVITAILVICVIDRKKAAPVTILSIILGILASLPTGASTGLQRIGVHGIHFYRYLWYLLIISPTVLLEQIQTISLKISGKIPNRTWQAVSVVVLIAFLSASEPKVEASLSYDFSKIEQAPGRVVDVSRHAASFSFPYTMEHLLVKEKGFTGTNGLFFESSNRGLQYYAFKNAIDPRSWKNGTYPTYFTNMFGIVKQPLDLSETADLLGINYITYTTKEPAPDNRPTVQEIGRIDGTGDDGMKLTAHYLLEKVSDTKLVDTLSVLPKSDPQIDLGKWWIESDRKTLFTESKVEPPASLNLSHPEVRGITIKPTEINFNVDSNTPAPVVVKFTYSPYWQAKSIGDGSTTQPVWITPGHLFVFANGQIQLTWVTPRYLKLFSPLSLTALIVLSMYCFARTIYKSLKTRPDH